MARPELSLVIPIYNEEEVLATLDARIRALLDTLGVTTEVIFVDDGSKDRSLELLRAMTERDARYRVVSFARNFGHQRAITCGLEATRGKAVVVIDADLQDPPEVIVEMMARWREGYDVVYGRRRSREGETWFKLFSARVFYRLFAAMIPISVPLDAGDFRLMSRRVVLTLGAIGETHRFIRGLVAWVGFRQTAVEYDRAPRAAGTTKYPLKKMVMFALDGIASFSVQPLRLATYLGVIVGAGSVLYAMAAVITYAFGHTVPGWTTTVVLVAFLFSVQLLVMGVLGEYVGRIYEEVKGRPLFVIKEKINFGKARRRRTSSSGPTTPRVPIAALSDAIDARPTTIAPAPAPAALAAASPSAPAELRKPWPTTAKSSSGFPPPVAGGPRSAPPRPSTGAPRASVPPRPSVELPKGSFGTGRPPPVAGGSAATTNRPKPSAPLKAAAPAIAEPEATMASPKAPVAPAVVPERPPELKPVAEPEPEPKPAAEPVPAPKPMAEPEPMPEAAPERSPSTPPSSPSPTSAPSLGPLSARVTPVPAPSSTIRGGLPVVLESSSALEEVPPWLEDVPKPPPLPPRASRLPPAEVKPESEERSPFDDEPTATMKRDG